MIVYSLNAHIYDAFPYQVAAIRKYCNPERIVCVQGPFGHTFDSKVALSIEEAEKLDVELLEVPAISLGYGTYGRQPLILQWLLPCLEGPSLILQGDCFPTVPMTLESLLDGFPYAGRAHLHGEYILPEFTFLAASGPIQFEPPYWKDHDFKMYRCEREGMYENCDAGFWHADKLSYWHVMKDKEVRMSEVKKRFEEFQLSPEESKPMDKHAIENQIATDRRQKLKERREAIERQMVEAREAAAARPIKSGCGCRGGKR